MGLTNQWVVLGSMKNRYLPDNAIQTWNNRPQKRTATTTTLAMLRSLSTIKKHYLKEAAISVPNRENIVKNFFLSQWGRVNQFFKHF